MKTIRLIMFIILMISIDNAIAQPIPPAHGNGLNQAPSGGGAPIDKGDYFPSIICIHIFMFEVLF